jgi:hypothetical protein
MVGTLQKPQPPKNPRSGRGAAMRDSTLILVAAVVMLGTGFWITGLILLALTYFAYKCE